MRDKLSQLVEELTTSGEPQLNQDKMKEVKKICKYDMELLLVSFCSQTLFHRQLENKIRFRTFWERFNGNTNGDVPYDLI